MIDKTGTEATALYYEKMGIKVTRTENGFKNTAPSEPIRITAKIVNSVAHSKSTGRPVERYGIWDGEFADMPEKDRQWYLSAAEAFVNSYWDEILEKAGE